jgi:TRAP-type C4-dicarboxylate transport system permease small subunit
MIKRDGFGSLRVFWTRASMATQLVAYGLLASSLLIAYEVVGRKYFAGASWLGTSLEWVEELSSYIIAWVVFIFVGVVAARSSHVVANVLPRRFEESRALPLRVVFALSRQGIAFYVGALWVIFGVRQIRADHAAKAHSISALSAPFWIVHLCVPLGGVALIVGTAFSLRRRQGQAAAPDETLA